MRGTAAGTAIALLLACGSGHERGVSGQQQAHADGADDPIAELVGRLDLDRYKAVIKGLTQFGDRRQGTRRNREAVDWIEAQLEAAGCPTERLHYNYDPPPRPRGDGAGPRGAGDSPLNPTGADRDRRAHRDATAAVPAAAPSSATGGIPASSAIPWPSRTKRCAR